MATLHRARVVALGSEEDMRRLCQALLQSSTWAEEQEDAEACLRLPLPELMRQVRQYAHQEGGAACEFCYSMLGTRLYGGAEAPSCRLNIRRENCGLWTATFAYDSGEPFQQEDWMGLHKRCGRMLMLALRASEDFARARGMLIFTGGRVLENWDAMDECWLYLMRRYECGCPPEEAVADLHQLEKALQMEEADLSVGQWLAQCMAHLQRVAADASEPEQLQAHLTQCREAKDYEGLLALQCRVAEYTLWEAEHNSLWLANLAAVQAAWKDQA